MVLKSKKPTEQKTQFAILYTRIFNRNFSHVPRGTI